MVSWATLLRSGWKKERKVVEAITLDGYEDGAGWVRPVSSRPGGLISDVCKSISVPKTLAVIEKVSCNVVMQTGWVGHPGRKNGDKRPLRVIHCGSRHRVWETDRPTACMQASSNTNPS